MNNFGLRTSACGFLAAAALVLPPAVSFAGMYGDTMAKLRRQYSGDSLSIRLGGIELCPTNSNVVVMVDEDYGENNQKAIHVNKAVYDRFVIEVGVPQPGDELLFRGAWEIEIKDRNLSSTSHLGMTKTKYYQISYTAYFRANQMQRLSRGTKDGGAPSSAGQDEAEGEDIADATRSAEAEEEKQKAAAARISMAEVKKRTRCFEGKNYLVHYGGDPKYAESACRYFDKLAEKFEAVLSSLGIALHPPPAKLTAVIFKNYDDYAATTGIRSSSCPGFYCSAENALYVYDYRTHPVYVRLTKSVVGGAMDTYFDPSGLRVSGTGMAIRLDRWLREMTADVMIHEAAHQLCYNTGFFAQTGGAYPTWLVEGIAQYFEHPSYWDFHEQPAGNINVSALSSFKEGLALGRAIPLKELLVPHEGFFVSLPDRVELAYAESWALFYYLMHGAGGKYRPNLGRYLAHLNGLQDAESLSDGEKIVLFRRFFQVEPLLLEKQWLEYVQGLREESLAIPTR
ncbi:MAG: DUF1570 domain-containing protein [Candidatus Aureabacteria bacterium]|nr:DUF1570 domain-containing protein [Candidatus Auribacterota bacterium]